MKVRHGMDRRLTGGEWHGRWVGGGNAEGRVVARVERKRLVVRRALGSSGLSMGKCRHGTVGLVVRAGTG